MKDIAKKLNDIDRRWIFLIIALAAALPLLFPLHIPTFVTKEVDAVFDAVEESGTGGKAILLSLDYDPSTIPELYPMTLAIVRHCFSRNIPLIVMTLHPAGPGICEMAVSKAAEEYGKVNHQDYVNFGFVPGIAATIRRMGIDIHTALRADYYGTRIQDIPLMEPIRTYRNIALCICVSAASYPDSWIAYAVTQYGLKFASGVTAVMAAEYYPYLQSGQMIGLLGGLKGAAEYERLLDEMEIADGKTDVLRNRMSDEAYSTLMKNRMRARIGMDAQFVVHIVIIMLIIVGNMIYIFYREQAKFSVRE
jgi:hypothetical protein